MNNRSVPANVVLPHNVYEDIAAAIEWLTETTARPRRGSIAGSSRSMCAM